MGKQKQTWKHFVALWSRFGIEPQEASEILVKNWLYKNYDTSYGNIWKDKENRKYFINLVNYIYKHMKYKNLKWRAACLDLAKKKPETIAKLLGQFRQEFFDRGWLDSSERPEIQSEKSLRRLKLLKKKRKTRR